MAQGVPSLAIQFPVQAETLRPPFCDDFPGYTDGMCRSEPGGFYVSGGYGEHAEEVYRFQPRADDTWVLSFPKSGTTWTQEMVWLINSGCDFEGAKVNLNIRSPFLEFPFIQPKSSIKERLEAVRKVAGGGDLDELYVGQNLDSTDQMPSPRLIKSHVPIYQLHPKLLDTCKVVYVARNPKDVIVSYFHHHKLIKFHNFTGDMAAFAEYFMNDQVMYSPYFPHLLEAWNLRHHPNLLFIFYEDLKRDLRAGVVKVADFLQKPLTDGQVDRLTAHLRFDNFAKNESVNHEYAKDSGAFNRTGHFVRKGKTGDWKNYFGPELNERIDRWIESNLAGSDLKFITELAVQD